MAATHLQEDGTGPCLPLFGILLRTVHKHLKTEGTGCWTFGRGMLSHSCLMYYCGCSIVLGLLEHFFCLDAPNDFSWWEIWATGGLFKRPDSSDMKWIKVFHCWRCLSRSVICQFMGTNSPPGFWTTLSSYVRRNRWPCLQKRISNFK